VVQALQIPIYELDGYEADDVIATLAAQAGSKSKFKNQNVKFDMETIIVTGDRDLLQLVNDKVRLFMPVKGLNEGKLYGEKETAERMGVKPEQITELKGLMGDPSDNYPGVSGIGPKTAISLISQFGTIENIYRNLDKIINQNVREKLENGKEIAFLSHKLATVIRTVPVKFEIEKSVLAHDLLSEEVIEVFGNLGFKTLLKRLSNMSRQVSDKLNKELSKEEKKEDKKNTESNQQTLF
jgi:DNA polymerase-1